MVQPPTGISQTHLVWCLFRKGWPQPPSLLTLFLPFQLKPVLALPSAAAAGTERCTQLLSSGHSKAVDAFFSAAFVQEDCAMETQARNLLHVFMQIVSVLAVFQLDV